ncbi:hypothetical protein B0I35DRAFT_401919 [Stachybotrys elegans]|uniref:Zn(2)-C6 fungal-type domain-containing protein n=1 Tax=Stachybotrys elegans TaxID=80388 RepID=A0A8K0S948_9HYPO|nr:hypothetical protein B0I35DRAFT_401919 [Stachybotrys elegans]
MVGVPGGSKGCLTCRKRRIKCDQTRPLCQRCDKAGYKCQGYERALDVRTHSFASDGMTVTTQVSKPERLNSGPQAVELTVPPSLSLVAFKDVVEFSFLLDNFVWRTFTWPWLELCAQGKLGQLPLDACQCLAQNVFGTHHHQQDIQLQGLVLYGQAVREMTEQLKNPGADLIVPILLLMMNASNSGDRQAAQFHVGGLFRVIQACKPASFAKLPLLSAFESARSTLFTISLITKQRCFLEADSWKTEPWRNLHKSPQNELVDIMVDIPGIMQGLAEDKDKEVIKLRSNLSALDRWRMRWEHVNPAAAWELAPADLPEGKSVGGSRVFSEVLWFQTFTQATEVILYNSALLCILGLLAECGLGDELPKAPTISLLGQETSAREAAQQICRAFEFQLLNVAASRDSALFWLLPLGIADKVLESDGRFRVWIQSLLDESKKLRRYGTGTSEFAFGHFDFLSHII